MQKIRHPDRGGFAWFSLKDHERFDLTQLSEFRQHLTRSIEHSMKPLLERENELATEDFEDEFEKDGFRSHLQDQQYELTEIERLAQELAIVALNKKAEISTNAIIDWYLPNTPKENRHRFFRLPMILGFKLDDLDGYEARNELRELNNAIKHEGKVGNELARDFPAWGSEHAPLPNLGPAYDRLAPEVHKYMRAFVTRCQQHSQFEP